MRERNWDLRETDVERTVWRAHYNRCQHRTSNSVHGACALCLRRAACEMGKSIRCSENRDAELHTPGVLTD